MSVQKQPPVREATRVITLPSGLSGSIRRLKLKELNLLTQKGAELGQGVNEMLNSTWLKTTDPGPYREPYFDATKSIDWNKILLGDKTMLYFQLRRLQVGDKYFFSLGCNNRLCGKKLKISVDLSKITVSPPSEEALTKLTNGDNLFKYNLPISGSLVGIKLFTGADEIMLAKISRDEDTKLASSSMLLRCPFISGHSSPKERATFIEEMDYEDYEYLEEQWKNLDIDIDTEVEVRCKHCGQWQNVEIPTDFSFFSKKSAQPSKK